MLRNSCTVWAPAWVVYRVQRLMVFQCSCTYKLLPFLKKNSFPTTRALLIAKDQSNLSLSWQHLKLEKSTHARARALQLRFRGVWNRDEVLGIVNYEGGGVICTMWTTAQGIRLNRVKQDYNTEQTHVFKGGVCRREVSALREWQHKSTDGGYMHEWWRVYLCNSVVPDTCVSTRRH